MLTTTIGEVLTKFADRDFVLAGTVYMSSSGRGTRIGIAISSPFFILKTLPFAKLLQMYDFDLLELP